MPPGSRNNHHLIIGIIICRKITGKMPRPMLFWQNNFTRKHVFTFCSHYDILFLENTAGDEEVYMLKERERKILDYMKEEIRQKGYPPTVREICSALNIKSTSTAHKDIDSLVKQGFIKKDPSKPRALMIVDNNTDSLPANPQAKEYTPPPDSVSHAEVVDIPIIGRIAAGIPILAEQNVEDSFPVPARFIGSGTTFMLVVKGESMIEAGIMDGDYILVEQQQSVRNGDIVVAMVDGFESEATVKTFYKEAGHIRLQPENSSMSPIIVKDARILGKVKGVFRYF